VAQFPLRGQWRLPGNHCAGAYSSGSFGSPVAYWSIRFLPSHPHEGAVSAPGGNHARVIATGTSKATGRSFNIAVAFEAGAGHGRAIAQSTFHHFADYNWDTQLGAPSFVEEPPGGAIAREPSALADAQQYARNVAAMAWSIRPLAVSARSGDDAAGHQPPRAACRNQVYIPISD
jgi:hypothetical protein